MNGIRTWTGLVLIVVGIFLLGCAPETAVSQTTPTPQPATATPQPIEVKALAIPTATNTTVPSPTPVDIPPTPTTVATQPPTIVPTLTPTTTIQPTLTPTPIGSCVQRVPQDDLLTIVTQKYGLGRDYAPSDLIPLADYFPFSITNGYPTQIRAVVLEPLKQLLADMEAFGLRPNIISGYRSYAQQNIAYQKWLEKEPERAAILSARPGHSEHQLGTVVDFGSPELASIVGDPTIEFHTYFYKTSEGVWLAENAYIYGFTLSYPRSATETTGFFYEPWHFRYVGPELAAQLHETGQSLTEYQLGTMPEPCIPS